MYSVHCASIRVEPKMLFLHFCEISFDNISRNFVFVKNLIFAKIINCFGKTAIFFQMPRAFAKVLQIFLILKQINFFSAVNFSNFWSSNTSPAFCKKFKEKSKLANFRKPFSRITRKRNVRFNPNSE